MCGEVGTGRRQIPKVAVTTTVKRPSRGSLNSQRDKEKRQLGVHDGALELLAMPFNWLMTEKSVKEHSEVTKPISAIKRDSARRPQLLISYLQVVWKLTGPHPPRLRPRPLVRLSLFVPRHTGHFQRPSDLDLALVRETRNWVWAPPDQTPLTLHPPTEKTADPPGDRKQDREGFSDPQMLTHVSGPTHGQILPLAMITPNSRKQLPPVKPGF
jgi:hypothetical protein